MTDVPKAPGSSDGSSEDELFELDDLDFQPVEPTGKTKTPNAVGVPVSTATIQIVTGEIGPEPEPEPEPKPSPLHPQAAVPVPAPRTPPAPLPPEDTAKGKNSRQALHEALAQLQRNKGAAPGASMAPTSPPVAGSSSRAGAPSRAEASPFAAPPLVTPPPAAPALVASPLPAAASTSFSASAPPPPAATSFAGAAPPPQPVAGSFSIDRVPSATARPAGIESTRLPKTSPPPAADATPGLTVSSEFDLTPLPGPAPWDAAATSEVEVTQGGAAARQAAVPQTTSDADMRITGEMQVTPETRKPRRAPPAPASAPRLSLQEQARLAKQHSGMPDRPEPEPSAAPAKAPQQDLPFQKPLLTPMAGSPETQRTMSATTETALAEAMPQGPTPVSSIGEPTAATWRSEAPAEEAPAMMDMLPREIPAPPLSATVDDMPLKGRATVELPELAGARLSALEPALEAGADARTDAAHAAEAENTLGSEPLSGPETAPSGPFVSKRTPTRVLPIPGLAERLKRYAPYGIGAAALTALAIFLVLRHHHAVPPPEPGAVASPAPAPVKAVAAPHKEKIRAPRPVMPAVTETLSLETMDRVGYQALAAGVETLVANPRNADAGLLAWARWRLATRFEDTVAKSALEHALDALPPRGPIDVSEPLVAAAQAGMAIQTGRLPQAKRLLIALAKSPVGKLLPQVWTIQAMWQSRRPMPPSRLIGLLDRILRASPGNVDVRLWRAEVLLRRDTNEGVRVMADLARRKDPDTIARIAGLLAAVEATRALPGILEPLEDGSSILAAAPAHQADLLHWFAASRVLRGEYEAPRSLAEALARGDGDAPAVAVWARLTQYQGDDPGGVLQQGIDAQSDKGVRGWLLYEAVRLALERRDMDHAKFLADGMNSMPQADIGAFAPLAAARVAQANNQGKQATQLLSTASQLEPENRSVQIARALEQSSLETPIRWTGAPPTPPEILLQRARAAAASGQGSVAARLAEEAFWRDPTFYDPVVLLGLWSGWLDQAGEALRAESLLERMTSALPDDDRPVIQLIKQARRGKRYDAAVRWYEVLLKRRPGDPELTVALAKTYIDAQKPETAAEVLSAAEHADPNVRTPVFMTTMAGALSKKDPTRARNLLAVALRVQPSADSYVLLADMENAAGHPEEELRALQAALPLAPDDGPLHLRVAGLLRDKRMNNQAMALLQPLLNHGESMEMLGDLLQESGDLPDAMTAYEHAEDAYRRADTDRARQAGLLVKVGVVQLQSLHDAKGSIKTLQKAVGMAPGHADTYYWLSRAFARSGMRKVTKKLLVKYLRLAPDGQHAEEARRELKGGRRGASAVP